MRDTTEFYHEGQRTLQDRFDGRRLADALEKHLSRTAFSDSDIRFIEDSEFFFLATAHGRDVDCSFKGGPKGFVKVTGLATLEWPDYDGNSMYRSLGNVVRSPDIGLLFIRFGSEPRRLRVSGTCELVEQQASSKFLVRVTARRIFPNCPRYIPDLAAGKPSPYLPDACGPGKKPGWKDMEHLRDALPGDDPHNR